MPERPAPRGSTPPPTYLAALAAVAVVMAALPVIYAGLVIGAGWGAWRLATEWLPLTLEWRLPMFAGFFLGVTPVLLAVAVAVALVKPLFARRGRRMQPLALNRDFEPRVHALVEDVCAAVGAPPPARVELDCAVNAAAGFDGGWRGLLTNRLVLTLGMPLVAGLTQRELAGVIAHEFGHFRQGAGMRLSYVVRSVNRWFARVIYERDAVDEWLEEQTFAEHGLIALVVQAGVALSRGVLWLLMTGGHAVSAWLLRQMEFDADQAEIAVAGSAAFESTFHKIAALSGVMADVHQEMRRSLRRTLQLPDNLPLLVGHRAERLTGSRRERFENAAALEQSGWLDTHPSQAERVARARACVAQGVAGFGDEPARELFEDFVAVSRFVTLAHYEDDLNFPTSPDCLIPIEAMITGNAPVAAAAPAPGPAAAPAMPMMRFDPSAFRPAGESARGDGE